MKKLAFLLSLVLTTAVAQPVTTPLSPVAKGAVKFVAGESIVPDMSDAVAWYRQGQGVTVTGAGVSTWADQSGNGNDLDQASDTSRPAYIEHSGTNYMWLPGVAGNYASTPDAAALDITGAIDIRVKVSLDDWTPAANNALIGKWSNAVDNESYILQILTTGEPQLILSVDGSAATFAGTGGTATGFTDGTTGWVRATFDPDTDEVKYYTKTNDSDAFVQLGSTRSDATLAAIFSGDGLLTFGAVYDDGSINPSTGKIYRAQVYNGIDGTLVFDAAITAEAEGTTSFAESSSNAATVTINSTGALKAQIVGSSSILFDGVDNFLKTAAFTLVQPETVYILFKQVTWTIQDSIFDGNVTNTGRFLQNDGGGYAGVSPFLQVYAGSYLATSSTGLDALALDTYGTVAVVFNGASSSIEINSETPITGDAGANDMGGFALGVIGGAAANFSNIQVKEVIIYNVAHNASQRVKVIGYLNRVGGL